MSPPAVCLVVMPGLDGTGLLLQDFARHMAPLCETRVLSYPPEMARYEELAPWVTAQLPKGPHVLLAESFSGPLAVRVARAAPEGLVGVIFITSFVRAPVPVPPFLAGGIRGLPLGSALALKMMTPFTTGRHDMPDASARMREVLRAVPATTLAGRMGELLGADDRAALAELRVPHACIAAKGDRLVPARRARELCQGACHTEQLEGPHFLMQTRPEAAAQAVAACIAALTAAAEADREDASKGG